MNGIIIDGKVYEAVPTISYSDYAACDLNEVCEAHAYDFCNDCAKVFDTNIDDAYWHFRYSQELTEKSKVMNRQIKFRGRSLTNGKWVCGDSIKHTENASENGTEILTYIGGRVENARKVGAMKWVSVDPDTVGQFTGLHDQNNKEIYEGDVITVRGDYPRVILWDKVSWAIMPCELYNDKHFWVMNLQHPGNDWWEEFSDEMEIICNVHDNPELLKE